MIFIGWITELIEKIPDILLYIIPGYIFVSIFNFILFKDKRNNENSQTDFIILKSVTISYIFKLLFDSIIRVFPFENFINNFLYAILLVGLSAIFSYSTALICRSKVFNNFLLKIGIHRTVNSDIWMDIITNGCWLRVFSKDKEKIFLGQCRFHESHKSEPIVVLTNYQILNKYNEVLCNYSNDSTRKIVLNLKEFERVEVVDILKN